MLPTFDSRSVAAAHDSLLQQQQKEREGCKSGSTVGLGEFNRFAWQAVAKALRAACAAVITQQAKLKRAVHMQSKAIVKELQH
jgi:major membrane immunogen (membrane-anchored lipoprotein)